MDVWPCKVDFGRHDVGLPFEQTRPSPSGITDACETVNAHPRFSEAATVVRYRCHTSLPTLVVSMASARKMNGLFRTSLDADRATHRRPTSEACCNAAAFLRRCSTSAQQLNGGFVIAAQSCDACGQHHHQCISACVPRGSDGHHSDLLPCCRGPPRLAELVIPTPPMKRLRIYRRKVKPIWLPPKGARRTAELPLLDSAIQNRDIAS